MSDQLNRRVFQVMGMTCGHCKAAVESAIRRAANVREVSVDLKAGKAVVVGGPADDAISILSLSPVVAGLAMSLSSFCVVTNALRLRGWK